MAVQEDHGLFRHGTELRLRDIFVLFREFLGLLCAVRVVTSWVSATTAGGAISIGQSCSRGRIFILFLDPD
jgi:hypothetical protein